jgi:hypothetical protein
MSLDVCLKEMRQEVVWDGNITHNLGEMARAAGIYMHIWRPEELGFTTAGQLIEPLNAGLSALRSDPERFWGYNPENGYGTYESLVRFVTSYLAACREHPNALVKTKR